MVKEALAVNFLNKSVEVATAESLEGKQSVCLWWFSRWVLIMFLILKNQCVLITENLLLYSYLVPVPFFLKLPITIRRFSRFSLCVIVSVHCHTSASLTACSPDFKRSHSW